MAVCTTQRSDGWWWVRYLHNPRAEWTMCKVSDGGQQATLDGATCDLDSEDYEWGTFHGKTPRTGFEALNG